MMAGEGGREGEEGGREIEIEREGGREGGREEGCSVIKMHANRVLTAHTE